jgi:glycine hydroxymethyltransferase
VTTRGFKEEDMRQIAHWIDRALANKQDVHILEEIKQEVLKMTEKYPLYKKGV